MTLHRLVMPLAFALVIVVALDNATAQHHLAVSHDNEVTILDAETTQIVDAVTAYRNVGRLAYRPDGRLLALGVCFSPRVVELKTSSYVTSRTPFLNNCPWALSYSPDNRSLAETFQQQQSSIFGMQIGRLRIRGPQPLNRSLGSTIGTLAPRLSPLLPALAYRPGGGELAVATPTGFRVLTTVAGYPTVAAFSGFRVSSLAYTTDGDRLLVGTSAGFQIRNAGAGYALLSESMTGGLIDIAVAPSGGWIALVSAFGVSVRRASDLMEVRQITSTHRLVDADFASDGSLLAVAEQTGQIRRFRVGSWQELSAIAITTPVNARINSIAFRPRLFGQRIPVLLVHGHSGNSAEAWFQPGSGANSTSFAAALAANPQLPIDAFYLELPVHDGTHNLERSITDDAQDILAMIEGGADSHGNAQVGILNMPAYRSAGRVAIIGYSQGTLSSRYYIKNLMGSRRNGLLTVSEFVALAAPNHGVGDIATCGNFVNPNMPDRTRRQLCAGRVGTLQNCGCALTPRLFSNNQVGDDTFISDLNGHSLSDTCDANASFATEAPFSRPTRADGIRYVNLFGNGDGLVGDNSQAVDCVGRRRARNLAPDVLNRELSGVPTVVHSNVPHHFEVICTALKTVTDHQVPDAASPCAGLTPP